MQSATMYTDAHMIESHLTLCSALLQHATLANLFQLKTASFGDKSRPVCTSMCKYMQIVRA